MTQAVKAKVWELKSRLSMLKPARAKFGSACRQARTSDPVADRPLERSWETPDPAARHLASEHIPNARACEPL